MIAIFRIHKLNAQAKCFQCSKAFWDLIVVSTDGLNISDRMAKNHPRRQDPRDDKWQLMYKPPSDWSSSGAGAGKYLATLPRLDARSSFLPIPAALFNWIFLYRMYSSTKASAHYVLHQRTELNKNLTSSLWLFILIMQVYGSNDDTWKQIILWKQNRQREKGNIIDVNRQTT